VRIDLTAAYATGPVTFVLAFNQVAQLLL